MSCGNNQHPNHFDGLVQTLFALDQFHLTNTQNQWYMVHFSYFPKYHHKPKSLLSLYLKHYDQNISIHFKTNQQLVLTSSISKPQIHKQLHIIWWLNCTVFSTRKFISPVFPMRHECSIQHNVFSFHLIKCSSTGHCSTTGTFPKSPNLQSSDCSDCSTLVQRLSNHYRMKYYSFHTAPPSSLFTARLRVCIRDAVSG